MGGDVLIETVYSWPGLGRYAVLAFMSLDINAVVGVAVFIALIYALANLVVDVLYFYLDPRIRIGG